jgi:hypothetical protein
LLTWSSWMVNEMADRNLGSTADERHRNAK